MKNKMQLNDIRSISFDSDMTYSMSIEKQGSKFYLVMGCECHSIDYWKKNAEKIIARYYEPTNEKYKIKKLKALKERIKFAEKLIKLLKEQF